MLTGFLIILAFVSTYWDTGKRMMYWVSWDLVWFLVFRRVRTFSFAGEFE